MAVGPLFFGILLLAWLTLGTAGWLIATVWRRRASLPALALALLAAMLGGALPGLIGWRTLPALVGGLALALVCSTVAAWQTGIRMSARTEDGSDSSRVEAGEQEP